jgi:hypothetical protein
VGRPAHTDRLQRFAHVVACEVMKAVSKVVTGKVKQKPTKEKHLPKSRGKIDALTSKCWEAASYAYAKPGCVEPPNLDFIDLSAFISWREFDDCQNVDSLKKLLPNQAARQRSETKERAEKRAQKQLETFLTDWKRGSTERWKLFGRAEKSYLHGLVSQLWSSAVFTSNMGFTLEAQFEAIRLYSAELWAYAQRRTGASIIQPSPVYSEATTKEMSIEAARIFCLHIGPDSSGEKIGEKQFKELENASSNVLLNAAAALFTAYTPLMLMCLRAAVFADTKFFETLSKAIQDLRASSSKGSFGVLTPTKEDQHAYRMLNTFVAFTRQKGRLPAKKELNEAHAEDMSEPEISDSSMSNVRNKCGLSGLPKGTK